MVIEHIQEVGLFVSNLLFEEHWLQPGIKSFFPPKARRKALPYNLSKAEGQGWSWIWQGTRRKIRGKLRRSWCHCWMREGTWWHGLSWVALTGDGTGGQEYKLKPIKFLLNTIKLLFVFFSMRMVRHLNRLFREVLESPSLEILGQSARGGTLPSVTSGGPCKDSGIKTVPQGFLWGSPCLPSISFLVTHTE